MKIPGTFLCVQVYALCIPMTKLERKLTCFLPQDLLGFSLAPLFPHSLRKSRSGQDYEAGSSIAVTGFSLPDLPSSLAWCVCFCEWGLLLWKVPAVYRTPPGQRRCFGHREQPCSLLIPLRWARERTFLGCSWVPQ